MNNLYTHRTLILFLTLFFFSFTIQAQEEGGIPGGCSDGIDNDGDGLIDCLDGDCGNFVAACPAFNFASACSPSGGIRGEIIDTETAFRDSNGIDVTFSIPAGAQSAIVYTSSTDILDNNPNNIEGNEDFIFSSSVLNLVQNSSAGIITYAKTTAHDGSGTTLFGWSDVAFGNKVSTGAASGHDINTPAAPLNDITFSVSGNTLTIAEDNSNIKTVYLVEFVSGSSNSLISNGIKSLSLDEGQLAGAVYIPPNSNSIVISAKGTTNKDNSNLAGGTAEPFSDMRFLADLDLNIMDGIVKVVNGGGTDYHSNYAFSDHDLTSTTDSLWDANTIAGDYSGKLRNTDGSTSTANLQVYIDGDSLRIIRDEFYGSDFDDVYVLEFYKKTGLPASSEFIETSLAFYEKGSPSGSVEEFAIPGGSNYVIFKLGGLAENSSNVHNENPVNAYAFIDLNVEKASGFYFQQVGYQGNSGFGRRDHNYAFNDVPLDKSSTRTHANTIGKNSANNQYDIEFELSEDKTSLFVYSYFGLVETHYAAVMQADFLGTKPDIAFDPNNITISNNGDCATVDVSVELCNPGSGSSPQGMPISFYEGDPTSSAAAIYLYTQNFIPDVEIGQCESDVIEVDLEVLTDNNIDVTVIINDDGSFANGVGNQIGTTFTLAELAAQSNPIKECDYSNNLTIRTINVNNCPVTENDNETTPMNVSIIVTPQSNDMDPDNDALITTILNDASNGSTIILDNDSISYTPNPGFFGMDTIVYQLSDGNGGIGTDTIFLEVTNILPVNLIQFNLEEVDCQNLVSWNSDIEFNFSHYELERSTDGIRFQKLALIEKKNHSGLKTYLFTDSDPYKFNYYRLRIINLDGTFEYSSIVNNSSSCQSNRSMTVFPNPIDQGTELQINLNTSFKDAAIKIVNITGSIVKEYNFSTRRGPNAFVIEIDDIPSGTYYIMNTTEPSAKVSKFIKLD